MSLKTLEGCIKIDEQIRHYRPKYQRYQYFRLLIPAQNIAPQQPTTPAKVLTIVEPIKPEIENKPDSLVLSRIEPTVPNIKQLLLMNVKDCLISAIRWIRDHW
jgi:hypothetical protein